MAEARTVSFDDDPLGLDNNHTAVLDFGKYRGERLTRVPLKYLEWLCLEGPRGWAKLAEGELERRDHRISPVDVTYHAINRASIALIEEFLEREDQEVGFVSWLQRMTEIVLRGHRIEAGEQRKVRYESAILVVEGVVPLTKVKLVTVWPAKGHREYEIEDVSGGA